MTIKRLENEILQKVVRPNELRKNVARVAVKNCEFNALEGATTLLDLFANKTTLFAVYNMEQACRYCTIWTDGSNAFLPHLESEFAVVLLSKDPPEVPRTLATRAAGDFAWHRVVVATISKSRASSRAKATCRASSAMVERGTKSSNAATPCLVQATYRGIEYSSVNPRVRALAV